jgi:hypothetical protein
MEEREDTETAEEMDDRQLRIEALAENLLKKRKLAIEHRAQSGVERRWLEDEEIYNEGLETQGKYGVTEYATGVAPIRQNSPTRSMVCANIVRGRCETAEGRFFDVAFPVDGKNWNLEVTPVPEIATALEDQRPAMQAGAPITDDAGQPVVMRDVALDLKARAEKAMEGMESEIDDQLSESDYNSEARKVISEAIKLGTGVLKGPQVIKEVQKSWKRQEVDGIEVHVLEMVEKHVPSSHYVSCWNVYPSPDCTDNIQKASYIWERDEMLARDIRALVGLPGYNEDILHEVLEEEPKRVVCNQTKSGRYRAGINQLDPGAPYESWEYHGDVDRDDLLALGCECGDDMPTYRSCVLFINDRPVKADLSIIDTGDLPFDFFVWSKVDGSPWGIGISRQMYWWQRIIRGALRMMMDNAADSSGANIVVSDMIEPLDGQWVMTGKKLWRVRDGVPAEDVRKAFSHFQLQNNQQQLQAIIDLALRFVDLETVVPAIFQGEAQEAPETLGATNIMVNSANIAFRMRLKHWDDFVTKPHIRRYYDWNMQYSKKPEIKGDFNVIPIGATSLYEQDQHAQRLAQVFALKGDPDVRRKVDWDKAIDQLFRAQHLDVLKAPDEIEQEQPQQPPPDPALQIAQMKAQAEMELAKLKQQSDMAELQYKAAESQKEREHQSAMKQLEVQMLMLKLSNDKGISLDSIKATLAGKAMDLNVQKELAYKVGKAKEVATPAIEPIGEAPDGQAFQR